MAKFMKRPVVVDAVRARKAGKIKTLEGVMQVNPGDWIITGVEGERYPCKHSVFLKTYKRVSKKNK